MMSMMNGSMLMMMIFWILVVGLVIYGVLLLISKVFEKKKAPAHQEDSALQILKERYARGEINEEEFEHKKRMLSRVDNH